MLSYLFIFFDAARFHPHYVYILFWLFLTSSSSFFCSTIGGDGRTDGCGAVDGRGLG